MWNMRVNWATDEEEHFWLTFTSEKYILSILELGYRV